jgi:amino acid transporter
VAAAQDQQTNVVLALAAHNLGGVVADLTSIVFITSVFAALVSFHQGVARYLFALGRERILPSWLGNTWHYTDSPVAGSVVHSLFAFAVVALFAALHRSPMLELFPWMSYVAAVGILLLMVGTSLAVIGYFRQWDTEENRWRRVIAPVLGGLALVAVTVVTVLNADAVLGAARGSALTWVLPGVAVLAGALGLAWGRYLQIRRPRVYAGIGSGG